MKNKKLINKGDRAQKQPQPKDFWDSLSPMVKAGIQQGLADVDAGRYSPIQPVIERLMSE